MKQLVLEEKAVIEILNYLNEIPRKYGDGLYNSIASLFNEQNPKEETEANESESDS